MMVKNEENFQKYIFLDIYSNNQQVNFLVHGHFSWSMFILHLVRGPKALKLHFQDIGPWKCDHEVRPWMNTP
jgi:hypothetical protein